MPSWYCSSRSCARLHQSTSYDLDQFKSEVRVRLTTSRATFSNEGVRVCIRREYIIGQRYQMQHLWECPGRTYKPNLDCTTVGGLTFWLQTTKECGVGGRILIHDLADISFRCRRMCGKNWRVAIAYNLSRAHMSYGTWQCMANSDGKLHDQGVVV